MKVKDRNYFLCRYCGELFSCSGICNSEDKDFCVYFDCGLKKLTQLGFLDPEGKAKKLSQFCKFRKEEDRTIKFLLKLKEKKGVRKNDFTCRS
ncbi:MAG: hypothetical protein DRN29_07075 [Thermoplasmata archaeon]|nr:MAG: hypothetical protein DRN29_07075 [Thermoplasmata archaeon]